MALATQPPAILRFGIFEVDLRAGELRKQGRRIKLQEQPFRALTVLLQHPGEVVTREELRRQIWPEDTFVDFDNSLNTSINKLREALGDSADNPRFIETLPRRGYRFLAPVLRIDGKEQSIINAPGEGTSATRRRRILALLAILAMLALGSGALALFTQQGPVLRVGQFVRLTNDGHDKSGNLNDGIPSPIVTDGTRVYFVEARAGWSNLFQVLAAGGDTLPISSPFPNVRLAGISPDRTRLLIGNYESASAVEQALYELATIGGSAHRLGDLLAHDAAWSPDGLSLAYATGDTLSVAKSDGTAAKKLVSGLGAVWWPRWSPDGAHLRFTVTQPKTQENSIWEIAMDRTHLREVSRSWNLPGDKCCGSWTPDGKYYVFQCTQWSGTTIWAVFDGNRLFRRARPVQLASGPIWAAAPALSTDGKRLFFIGWLPRTEPVRYDQKQKRLVSYLPGVSTDALDFTKDGQWITYTQYPEGSLWRARGDGTERVRLTSGALYAFRPRWSPDGTSIVFFGPHSGRPWKLYLLSASGGTPTQLISGDANEGDPTWSPDGKKIAFGRLPWMASAPEEPLLYILSLDSKRITTVPNSEGLFSPRWSPSGRYLAALSADSTKLMLYDFETDHWRQLAQGSYGNPEWSRDDSFLYPTDIQTMTVVRIHISDGKIDPVLDLHTDRFAFTGTGIWTGIAPDGSILTLRDLSAQELYSVELRSR